MASVAGMVCFSFVQRGRLKDEAQCSSDRRAPAAQYVDGSFESKWALALVMGFW